ncbi:MAG: fibronectin type III-like domain-contianing protein, partial [Clostridia bacterium]|nr:fibronectin type III-like domain-contianing protein [Clostridia bacterium]
PVEMPWIHQVKAVLEAYLGGQAVGQATVQVLYGDVNPSGHLAESFPVKLSDNPSFLFYGGEGNATEYREGVFIGYRYYDKKEMGVLFPFGHGLSYTTFEYGNLCLSQGAMRDTDTQTVTVTVKNTGSREGKAVVQLYIGAVDGDIIRPVRELKGFEKVALQPGESKDVAFTLDKRSFAYWNTALHDWHVATGQYVIEVGDSSRHLPLRTEITVTGTAALPRPHYDMDSIFMDIVADPKAKPILLSFMAQRNQGQADNRSDAAQEAITDEMNLAMMNYMPLRGMLSFDGVSPETLEALIKALNE